MENIRSRNISRRISSAAQRKRDGKEMVGRPIVSKAMRPMRCFIQIRGRKAVIGANERGNAENNTRDDVFRGWRRHTRHAMRQ